MSVSYRMVGNKKVEYKFVEIAERLQNSGWRNEKINKVKV